MKLAIVGSRGYNGWDKFSKILNIIIKKYNIKTIVSGGAKGADSLARRYAKTYNIELIEYLPDWDKYGKSAGFIRNSTIWNNSDMGIAFWDGVSKGTEHSFSIAKKQNKKLFIYDYNKDNFYIN